MSAIVRTQPMTPSALCQSQETELISDSVLKGQLGLSAPVITAHVCMNQHKGARLASRVPALASEMIMKSLRKVLGGKQLGLLL